MGVAQHGGAGGQGEAGGGDQVVVDGQVLTRSVCPLACTIRTASFSASAGSRVRSVSSRMVANDARRSPRRRARSRSGAAGSRDRVVAHRSPGRAAARSATGHHDLAPRPGPAPRRRARAVEPPLGTSTGSTRAAVPLHAHTGRGRPLDDARPIVARDRSSSGSRARRRATPGRPRRRAGRGTARQVVQRLGRPVTGSTGPHWSRRPALGVRPASTATDRQVRRAVQQVAPPVVEHEQEPAGQPRAARGRRSSRRSSSAATGRRSARPPSRPDSGRDHHVADQVVGGRRQQPGRVARRRRSRPAAAVDRAARPAAAGWRAGSGARRRHRSARPGPAPSAGPAGSRRREAAAGPARRRPRATAA